MSLWVTAVGYDFGWAGQEGSICNSNGTDPSCSTSGLAMPTLEYSHSVGSSVTGVGTDYRGGQVRSLADYYVYADFISGVIRSFRLLNGSPVESANLNGQLAKAAIGDFSVDGDGEVLAKSLLDGAVYRAIEG